MTATITPFRPASKRQRAKAAAKAMTTFEAALNALRDATRDPEAHGLTTADAGEIDVMLNMLHAKVRAWRARVEAE